MPFPPSGPADFPCRRTWRGGVARMGSAVGTLVVLLAMVSHLFLPAMLAGHMHVGHGGHGHGGHAHEPAQVERPVHGCGSACAGVDGRDAPPSPAGPAEHERHHHHCELCLLMAGVALAGPLSPPAFAGLEAVPVQRLSPAAPERSAWGDRSRVTLARGPPQI